MATTHGLQSATVLYPWDFPGKNTGVGCHFLLQGIFLTQESNPCLLHCQWLLLPLSHLGDLMVNPETVSSSLSNALLLPNSTTLSPRRVSSLQLAQPEEGEDHPEKSNLQDRKKEREKKKKKAASQLFKLQPTHSHAGHTQLHLCAAPSFPRLTHTQSRNLGD